MPHTYTHPQPTSHHTPHTHAHITHPHMHACMHPPHSPPRQHPRATRTPHSRTRTLTRTHMHVCTHAYTYNMHTPRTRTHTPACHPHVHTTHAHHTARIIYVEETLLLTHYTPWLRNPSGVCASRECTHHTSHVCTGTPHTVVHHIPYGEWNVLKEALYIGTYNMVIIRTNVLL